VRLYSRNANDWSARLSAIAAAAARIEAKSFTIDGEAVVLGPDGLSRFKESSRRESARTAILYAFDLIEHDDEDMRNLPFLDRPRWRGYCATPRQASCSMNTLPGTALWCSRTPAGLAPRASCRRNMGPIDPAPAASGSVKRTFANTYEFPNLLYINTYQLSNDHL
jgi:ATP dependent DNA ligase domain